MPNCLRCLHWVTGSAYQQGTHGQVNQSQPATHRGTWGSQIEFLLSCVGYAVGLGNLWRFPYLCMKNGGGAFLIPYFTFMLLCGIPLFYLELIIGQFSSLSPLSVWKISPLFKGLGWGMLIMSSILTIYYNVIISWVLYYLGASFTQHLPWASCDNPWNTKYCAQRSQIIQSNTSNNVLNNSSPAVEMSTLILPQLTTLLLSDTASSTTSTTPHNISSLIIDVGPSVKARTPAEEFWQFHVHELSDGIEHFGGIRWQLLVCLVCAWIIVFLCVLRGIKTSGKVVYVTATLPYVFLTVLLVKGLMMPGAVDGIKFYIFPDFDKLMSLNVWAEACLQIFYSLGPAWGGLITMASYNHFSHNCLRDAVLVPIINSGTSFYAGFVIFSVIGFMAHETGLPVQDVITSGPGLAFIAYPEALTHLPLAPVWSVLFFLMLLSMGLDSQFGMVESISSGFVDEFPLYLKKHKTLFTAVLCAIELVLGLPMATRSGLYIFQLLDWYAAAFSAVVIAFLECMVLSWIYGVERLYQDVQLMLGHRPSLWWRICWQCITPSLMVVILCFTAYNMEAPTYGSYHYPPTAIGIGWSIAMISLIPIPAVMLYKLAAAPHHHHTKSILQKIVLLSKPAADWGPVGSSYVHKYNRGIETTAQLNSTAATESSNGEKLCSKELLECKAFGDNANCESHKLKEEHLTVT